METPFDVLISTLWQKILNSHHISSPISEEISLLHTFSNIARVLYINMVRASEKMQSGFEARMKTPSNRPLTMREMIEMDDGPIKCKLSYFQFIEHINRTGRIFKKNCSLKEFLPSLYTRIRFYRNKMVEHWDKYIQPLSQGDRNGLSFTRGKISIPYAFAGIIRPDDNTKMLMQQQLFDEFAKCDVTLPPLTEKQFGEYFDIIYVALEKIDDQLRDFNKETGKGIPRSIVALLFKYSFPTPINDVEEYCKTLVEQLKRYPCDKQNIQQVRYSH